MESCIKTDQPFTTELPSDYAHNLSKLSATLQFTGFMNYEGSTLQTGFLSNSHKQSDSRLI